ncbi:DinB family protein [uncultured Tenacibaculum sp.]|uniref:DinB family protein n=1 Tax=uncultured Tenacibaculum sp. TaxID=174713 RepID=UPI00260DC0C4|nr:DinB family protein [uncultured Tenacibaculum sp.]
MTKKDLQTSEYNEYYGNYINLVAADTELVAGFEKDEKYVVDFFSNVPENKLLHRYQEGKWTIKEILQHIIDTERIFMYRFFRIARNDQSPLMGFEQNDYIEPSEANNKSLEALLTEFKLTRQYSLNLIASIPEEHLINMGTASNAAVSARACAYILLGHSMWHINIINERYL